MKEFKKYKLKIDGETFPNFGINKEFAMELQTEFLKQNKTVEIEEI